MLFFHVGVAVFGLFEARVGNVIAANAASCHEKGIYWKRPKYLLTVVSLGPLFFAG